jgi:hypothetical protein
MTNERRQSLIEAEDFFYKKDEKLYGIEKIVMFGGNEQALLDCYGEWVVVNESDIYLPTELTEQELNDYYIALSEKEESNAES